MYICVCMYVYIYIYIYSRRHGYLHRIHTGVREEKHTPFMKKPLPCSATAETALQPLIWCSAGFYSNPSC